MERALKYIPTNNKKKKDLVLITIAYLAIFLFRFFFLILKKQKIKNQTRKQVWYNFFQVSKETLSILIFSKKM